MLQPHCWLYLTPRQIVVKAKQPCIQSRKMQMLEEDFDQNKGLKSIVKITFLEKECVLFLYLNR